MMASDTLTEMESAASSMLNGPSNFSETWYRTSERKKKEGDTGRDVREIKFAMTTLTQVLIV